MSQLVPPKVSNQLLFREVNERLRETIGSEQSPLDFLCECSSEDCIETISLSLEDYDRVRSHSNLFFVAPGHERLEVERIVDQEDGFLLVQNTVAADAVIRADPRQRKD